MSKAYRYRNTITAVSKKNENTFNTGSGVGARPLALRRHIQRRALPMGICCPRPQPAITQPTTSHDTRSQDTMTQPTMTITATLDGVPIISDDAIYYDSSNNIVVTITTRENTTDFIKADIEVTNGTLSELSGSDKIYTAEFIPLDPNIECTIGVPAGNFTNDSGSDNVNSDPYPFIIKFFTIPESS